jgi:hypothetical protein
MDVRIEVKGQQEIERKIREVPGVLFQVANKAMKKTIGGLQQTMVRRSGGGEGQLKGRTGELKRSWRFNTTGNTIKTLAGMVESVGVKYARLHEYGGTITPKNAKWLTIPTDANKTKAGVTRMTARMVIQQGGFFAKNIIFLKQGNGKPVPMFILVKRVTIPARLGFRDQAAIYGRKLLVELDNAMEKGK